MKKLLVITPCAPNNNPTQGRQVAGKLAKAGTPVTMIPEADTGLKRLIEVTFKGFNLAARSDVMMVDVFGYRAFVYESLAILYGVLFKKLIVAVLHNGGMPEFVRSWPWWTHFILSKPDILVTPHRFLRDKLSSLGLRIDAMIPNYIDLDRYTYRLRIGLTPRFLYLRGLHPIYNPEMALRVFSLVQKDYPEAVLTLAGPDDGYLRACKGLVKDLNLHNVKFLGVVPKKDLPKLINEHDIFIQSNRVDNMPVSLLEAWASGLPVVATNVGGIPYLIHDGIDGILVESEDYETMAKKCIELLNDPEKARSLSQNGCLRAQEFTWENVSSIWMKALDLEFDDFGSSIRNDIQSVKGLVAKE